MSMTTKGITNPKDANGVPLPENLSQHMDQCSCAPCGPAPSRSMDVSDPDFSVGTNGVPAPTGDNAGDEDTSDGDDSEIEEATLAPGSGIVNPFGDSIQ